MCEQRGLAWGAILLEGPLLGATLAFNPVSQLKWDTNPAKEKAFLTPKVSAKSPATQRGILFCTNNVLVLDLGHQQPF